MNKYTQNTYIKKTKKNWLAPVLGFGTFMTCFLGMIVILTNK